MQVERWELRAALDHRQHRRVGDTAAATSMERRELPAARGQRHDRRVGDLATAQ